ncbi:spermatogenesis- and oogenesis-specific basic helix-loop-helix-containing protein 2 [Latimeria chalumnae]|uniref:spermatogenesis- and oogenesis-specific basic helix-loop-helix-containing protein 2 n=1 Tax=Latimeria chalumnae TaxID=7897 RepID=UPI0006D9411E|nr:PREDICTED: spermatogenesis- and oogenesis-specific basic helix-loop-helix-containing protein 2 [Latimeria chalumnae]|eukprot:XP_014352701.1 PREDICTED: spermatogenesis- and oogenesis-specific basic helix-loop-helix-containing protein 2 [Latimeria chalumnae]
MSVHGTDFILTEPVTAEKLKVVINCWKSTVLNINEKNNLQNNPSLLPVCSDTLNAAPGRSELRAEAVTDGSREDSFSHANCEMDLKAQLHSKKEKMRRDRIKDCCDQLRTLLPYVKGRKNDAASILEMTVDYIRFIRDRIPQMVLSQSKSFKRVIFSITFTIPFKEEKVNIKHYYFHFCVFLYSKQGLCFKTK